MSLTAASDRILTSVAQCTGGLGAAQAAAQGPVLQDPPSASSHDIPLSLSIQKQRNREAQRRFRARQKQSNAELHAELASLQAQVRDKDALLQELLTQNEQLRELAKRMTESPPSTATATAAAPVPAPAAPQLQAGLSLDMRTISGSSTVTGALNNGAVTQGMPAPHLHLQLPPGAANNACAFGSIGMPSLQAATSTTPVPAPATAVPPMLAAMAEAGVLCPQDGTALAHLTTIFVHLAPTPGGMHNFLTALATPAPPPSAQIFIAPP